MLSPKLQTALNDQINAEFGSAYTYLAMAAHLQATNLPGSAAWMQRQAREEVGHALKIFDFVNDRDGRVTLKAIPEPPPEFKSVLDIWESALKQEQGVTARIHFVTEQVEEEKTAKSILEQVKAIGPSTSAIYFLDRHLGKDAEAE
jgi:ferritin